MLHLEDLSVSGKVLRRRGKCRTVVRVGNSDNAEVSHKASIQNEICMSLSGAQAARILTRGSLAKSDIFRAVLFHVEVRFSLAIFRYV